IGRRRRFMRVCIFEDQGVSFLEPLALTRPAFDLRCGAWSLLERHQWHFASAEFGALVRPMLGELCRRTHPQLAVNDADWLTAGPVVFVNARWLPHLEAPADFHSPQVALLGEQVAFAVLTPEHVAGCTAHPLTDCLERWKQALPHAQASGWMIDYPWDLI